MASVRWVQGAIWTCAGLLALHATTACGSGEAVNDVVVGCPPVDPNGGGGIPAPPDGASLCPAGACNYQTQEGCSAGQACRPQFTATSTDIAPGCEAAGNGKSGAACAGSNECAVGYFCAEGTCRKLCCGSDWSACDAGESCFKQLLVKAGGAITYAKVDLCFPVGTCSVLDPTGCDASPGQDCKIVDPRGSEACVSKRKGKLGETCGDANLCERGLQCVGRDVKYCIRLCRAVECGEPRCPTNEGTCVHFDRDPEGVGECTPNWVIGAGK